MDKITLELPDYTDERRIVIIAGTETVYKREDGTWYRKTARCNFNCGKCCKDVPDNWAHGKGKDGHCQYLIYEANEYLCSLGYNTPLACAAGDGVDIVPDCTIVWEKI